MFGNYHGAFILILGIIGLGLSFYMEGFCKPKPSRAWPSFTKKNDVTLSAWAVHIGIWCLTYGLFIAICARPIFSVTLCLALMLTLVLINNTKLRSLNESLTAQDYEFITDIIMYPRIFLPHFGVARFIQATILFCVALVGLILEPAPENRLLWYGHAGAVVLLGLVGFVCLCYAEKHPLPTGFIPVEDMEKLGLLPTLWAHGRKMKEKPNTSNSPFASLSTIPNPLPSPLPHLVAVQSESFFDPRGIFHGIKPEILNNYDKLQSLSIAYGNLEVPSWGGSTVRSEFAFLTGLTQEDLGVHRFNPYVITASGFPIPSLPLHVKQMGYRTVFIHPYAANFYKRAQVFQHWNVDEYLSIKDFKQRHHYGPFMSDIEVARLMLKTINESKKPTLVFAITMENHGPLHLEKKREKDIDTYYTTPPPKDWTDLTAYLRHIGHADKMIAMLHKGFEENHYPISFCWYGDHVPIMAKVYDDLPELVKDSNYILWNNSALQKQSITRPVTHLPKTLLIHDLAKTWLSTALQ